MKPITILLITTTIAATAFAQEFNPAAQPYVVAMRQYQAEQAALSALRTKERQECRLREEEVQRQLNKATSALKAEYRNSRRAAYYDAPTQQRGNLVYTADGTYGYRYAGNEVHFQNGATATQYGNTAYFSNGATAALYGSR